MSSRKTTAALLTVGLLAGLMLLDARAEIDYSVIPPNPAEVTAWLKASGTSLREGIAAAEKAVSGVASSARFERDEKGVRIEVTVYAGGKVHDVVVDASTGEVRSTEARPPFELPGQAVSGDPTVTESGLMFYEIEAGGGEAPEPMSTVSVHYTGWLVDGRQFDSSVERGMPASFPLNRVIPGWSEGVGSMRVGGKRKLLIPYNLAYGPSGRPPVIPPKALLIFDVELLEIVE